MRDHPLHIVGVPQPGHICPAGKCQEAPQRNTQGALSDDQAPEQTISHPDTDRPAESPTRDPGHEPTQAELATFWSDEAITFTNPEGTQK